MHHCVMKAQPRAVKLVLTVPFTPFTHCRLSPTPCFTDLHAHPPFPTHPLLHSYMASSLPTHIAAGIASIRRISSTGIQAGGGGGNTPNMYV